MRSATAFLPESMITFMNLASSTLPNFGSGRISRLGTSRRRGIFTSFVNSVEPREPSLRPWQSYGLHALTTPYSRHHFSVMPRDSCFAEAIKPSSGAWRRTWNELVYDPGRLAGQANRERCGNAHPASLSHDRRARERP